MPDEDYDFRQGQTVCLRCGALVGDAYYRGVHDQWHVQMEYVAKGADYGYMFGQPLGGT